MINHKVVFIGDSAVGKTSIINQYMYFSVSTSHQPTVGIDFFAKNLIRNGIQIKMQIWDTAGQEKFHSLIPSYIRDSTVAIMVYDITSRTSFENLDKWHNMVIDIANPRIIVVGNKSDLEAERDVPKEDVDKFVASIGAKYIETSCRTPSNIEELFELISEFDNETNKQTTESKENSSKDQNQAQQEQTTTTTKSDNQTKETKPAPAKVVDISKPANETQNTGGCGC